MTAGQFVLGILRLSAIVLPLLVGARMLRRSLTGATGPLAGLAEAVIATSVLVVEGELLGLVAAMRPGWLILCSAAFAAGSWAVARRAGATGGRAVARRAGATDVREFPHSTPDPTGDDATPRTAVASPRWLPALVPLGLAVVLGQWLTVVSDKLGGGMLSFDSIWYHMPYAAQFAQTGSVTKIQFTVADPYVAYYPANSELLHALGIEAFHSDILSPFLNLLWLAVLLTACWCVGRRRRLERYTLLAGCTVASLPVLSDTQPGEAFNDIAGLAMLVAAVALVLAAEEDQGLLAVAGLALGFAVGTKVTFLVPAFVILVGAGWLRPVGRRLRSLVLLGGPLLIAGGWWYVRDLVAVGNPLGIRLQVGPLVIPGPRSMLADQQQGTVIANIRHLSLWGSRFAPGLHHALGVLWPLVLASVVFAAIAGFRSAHGPAVRLLAVTTAAAAITYVFLPTSASGINQAANLFQVNLRYLTPAIALAALLVPIIVSRSSAARLPLVGAARLPLVGAAMLAVLVAAQLERSQWRSQPSRHALFLLASLAVILAWPALVALARRLIRPSPTSRRRDPALLLRAAAVAGALLLVGTGAAYGIQRHYFHRRYVVGKGLFLNLFRWAQPVSHRRLAVYGTLEVYPLYGEFDTNRVEYLGHHTTSGGFVPIATCQEWRRTITAGHPDYLVITPGPTAAVPLQWTTSDPSARLVATPAPGQYVFALTGPMHPSLCGAASPA